MPAPLSSAQSRGFWPPVPTSRGLTEGDLVRAHLESGMRAAATEATLASGNTADHMDNEEIDR
eukprot:7064182-Alexandrium_andersonii.AAC.1